MCSHGRNSLKTNAYIVINVSRTRKNKEPMCVFIDRTGGTPDAGQRLLILLTKVIPARIMKVSNAS